MVKKAINVNHSTGSFISNDGTYITVGEDSAVKIGYGTSISNGDIDNTNSEILANYAGAIRINKTSKKLEYCNGTTWVEFVTKLEGEDIPLIYSFIF